MPPPRNIRNRNNKFDQNISKRGNVSVGKAGEREDEPAISKTLVLVFLVLIVGSSFAGVMRLFTSSKVPEA
eukprot:CAMPEP_0118688222 /NCGR_PEP_ID=MMETSP0800-20121206/8802_1 /TAXON_ID=210618 ORGANISM="Striatella unipunctata, Strain CCMP2910" /NCGR_SAMPLE_ID=MMETSP0800 /ASSEMBLY_ACC=CAM_ASM_000638 /LENGTH=70 /DNA_ID=CAMNT_0006585461 /DNA_START=149 /DNA_END=361 /DNA_ORIENTATION=+